MAHSSDVDCVSMILVVLDTLHFQLNKLTNETRERRICVPTQNFWPDKLSCRESTNKTWRNLRQIETKDALRVKLAGTCELVGAHHGWRDYTPFLIRSANVTAAISISI